MRLTPRPPNLARRRGRALAAAGVTVVLAAATITLATSGEAGAAPGCRVDYTGSNWGGGGGFTANLHITNLGDPLAGWTLTFSYANGQRITPPGWSANWTQAAGSANVSATPLDWNRNLATGQAIDIGFNGTFTGTTNNAPTSFSINGTVCTGQPGTPPTSTTTTTVGQPPTTTTTTPGNPGPGRVDNPYAGATQYVNPDWSARAAGEPGGNRISNQPTGVWMDRIAAIAGTTGARGLAAHLDEAVRQDAANGANALAVNIVIYDLPGRDCAALASNGELGPTDIGRYRTDYINPIRDILARPAYRNLRIVTIIEIDSLPNLVTNTSGRATATPQCDTMKANGNYVTGVAYALGTLGAVPNVYNYIDAGHHGWLGWDDNFRPAVQLMCQTATTAPATPANVQGFIVNTANYSALQEPFFNANTVVGGRPVREVSGGWVDFNRYVDELSFAQAWRTEANAQCFSGSNIGMLIDTSRNGWGGAARPTAASTSTDPITFMDQSRIDRRIHLGNWCNQSGAGLGERPRANPATGIDAYVWIKPPGESDGSSTAIPNDEGKGFDRMCDPTYTGNPRNNNHMSGALPNAPLSGAWFPAQFAQLMQNAFPPL